MNLKMSDFLFEEKDVQDLDKSNQADSEESESSSGGDKQNKRNKPKSELSDQQLKKGPEISWTEMDNIIAPNIAKVFFESSSNLKKNAQLKNQTKDKKEKELSSKEKIALKKASKVEDLPLGMLDRPLLNKLFQRNYAVGLQGKIGRIHINPFQTKTGADQIEGASPFDFEFAKQKQIFFGMLSNENSEIIRCLGKAVIVAFPAAGAKITEKNLPLCSLLYKNYSKDNPVLHSFPKVAFFLLPFNKFSDFQKSTFATVKVCLSQEKTPAKNESFVYQKGISSLLLEGTVGGHTAAAHDDNALHNDSAPNLDEDFSKFIEELSEESGKLQSILERLNKLDELNPEEMSSRLDELNDLKSQIADVGESFADICKKKSEEIRNFHDEYPTLAESWIGLIKAEVEKFREIFGDVDRVLESIKNKMQKDQDQSQESNQESGEESNQESAGESNKESAGDEEGEGDEEGDEESDEESDEEGELKPNLLRVRNESDFIVDFICESYLESIGEDSVETKNKKSREAKIKVKASQAVAAKQKKRMMYAAFGASFNLGLAYATGGASYILPTLAAGFFTNIFTEDNDKIQAREEAEKDVYLDENSITMDSVFREIKSNIKIDKEKEDLFNIIKEIVKESKRLTERSQLMSLRFLLNEEDEQKEEKSNSNQRKKLQKISKDFVVRIIEEENLKLYDLIDQNERLTKKFLSKLSGLLRRNFDIQITDIVPESVVESARDQALSVIDKNAKKGRPASPAIDQAARVDDNPVAKAVNEVNHSGNSDLVASMLAAMIADPKGFGQLFNSLKSEDKSGLQVILDFAKIDQDKVDVKELQGNVPEKISLKRARLEKIIEKINKVSTYSIAYTTTAVNDEELFIKYDRLFSDTNVYKDLISKQFNIKDEVDSYYDNMGLISSLGLIKRLIFEKDIKQKIPSESDEYMTSYAVIQALNYITSLKPKMSLTFYEERSTNTNKVKLFAKNDEIFLGRKDNKSNPGVAKDQSIVSLTDNNKEFKVVTELEDNSLRNEEDQTFDESFVVMQGRELIKEWRELWNI